MGKNGTDFLGFKLYDQVSPPPQCVNAWVNYFQVVAPYQYACIVDNDADYNSLSPQQATNVVKKNIIEHTQHDKRVFWYPKKAASEDEHYVEGKLKMIEASHEKVTPCCIEDYINLPINHAEKLDNLLRFISCKLSRIGATAHYQIEPEDFILCDVPIEPLNTVWYLDSKNQLRLDWHSAEGVEILNNLEQLGLLRKYWDIDIQKNTSELTINCHQDATNNATWDVSLTMKGWHALSTSGVQASDKVFIAMAFTAWENKDEQNRLISAIKHACKNFGYNASIVNQDHTDNITDKIMTEIKQSRFVICDFTYNNPGVYFEAGYARSLGKNVYHIVKETDSKNLHFDIRQINCRVWRTPKEVEEILTNWLGANEEVVKKTTPSLYPGAPATEMIL